jgi:TRAP-type uncharacterized transport system substrate-binding protein
MSTIPPGDPESPQPAPANSAPADARALRRLLKRLRKPPHISWRYVLVSVVPTAAILGALIFLGFHLMRPPPHTLTISAGPVGSTFYATAEKYRPILAREGIALRVLPSQGSLQNLQRLVAPHSGVDLALVQAGITTPRENADIVSLGSLFYEPLALFYRGKQPLERLSQLRGRYIGIGTDGSGTRFLATALLQANGITPDADTHFEPIEGSAAMHALLDGRVGAIFLSGDSATGTNFRTLLLAPGIRMFNFVQADAYLRHFRYLDKLSIPAGTFDLGHNLPHQPTNLLAPTVELLAHDDLHPALVDLLVRAAREVNGRGNVLQKPGEFPAPLERGWPIDTEAQRYYKSGDSVLYRFLPFWLASVLNRTWLVLVPLIVLLIPVMQFTPTLYGWLVRNRIYRRYGALMALERAALEPLTPEAHELLLKRLAAIESDIIRLKLPGAYANELYVLRQHVKFVQARLGAG